MALSTRYTDEEIRSVSAEDIANVTIESADSIPFSVDDPLNPGLSSQISKTDISINPALLAMRETGADMASSQLRDIQDNRTQTLGDQNTFIERRTAGLRENILQGSQDLSARLQKTGVTGEFGRQTRQNFEASGQQRLQQGELLALDEFTALANNLDNVEGGMLKLVENIDFNAFSQDLQLKGMQQDLINQLTRIEQGEIGLSQAEQAQQNAELGNWISILSDLFS